MKFRFDLLPTEYKSLPRDIVGLVVGIAAIVTCISWTTFAYWQSFDQEAALQKSIDAKHTELSGINDTISKQNPDMNKIQSLNNSIQFINTHLNTPGTSWVTFLYALEATVPDQVFIQDINPKLLGDKSDVFTLKGEAASLKEVLDFIKNMQTSGVFPDVFLKENSTHIVGGTSITRFSLSFKYARKD